jgi:hypothetical protein
VIITERNSKDDHTQIFVFLSFLYQNIILINLSCSILQVFFYLKKFIQ